MSESESSESRIRITRSLVGRLVAVGLFLIVGSTAVIYTISGRNGTKDSSEVDADKPVAESKAEAPSADAAPIPIAKQDTPTIQTSLTTEAKPPISSMTSQQEEKSKRPSPIQSTPMRGGQTFSITAQDEDKAAPADPTSSTATLPPTGAPKSGSQLLTPPDLTGGIRPNMLGTKPPSDPPPARSFTLSDPQVPNSQPQSTSSHPDARPPITSIDVEPMPSTASPPVLPKTGLGQQDKLGGPPANSSEFGSPRNQDEPANSFRNSSLGGNPIPTQNAAVPRTSWPTNNDSGQVPEATRTPYDNPSSFPSRPDVENPKTLTPGNFGEPNVAQPMAKNSMLNPQSKTEDSIPSSTPPTTLPTQSRPPTDPNRSLEFSNSSSNLRTNPLTAQSSPGGLIDPSNSPAPVRSASQTTAIPGDPSLEGPQSPTVTVEKIAPREVQLGVPAEFQITVTNASKTAAHQVVVHDRVPVGSQFVDSNPRATQPGVDELQWDLGTLQPNEKKRIVFKLRPNQTGEFGSVATVTFSAQATARTICTQPVLALSIKSKPAVLIGDDLVMDIVVENKGDGPAKNVYLQETVPDQLQFAGGLRELEYDVGTLAPGQKHNVQLHLTAAKVGTLRNELVAVGDGNLQAIDAVDVRVVSPSLRVTGEGPTKKYLNREALHLFSVQNDGTAPATNVALVAKLPKGLKFVRANNYGQYDPRSHTVHWSMPDLKEGLSGTVELATMPIEPGEQTIQFSATADLGQQASTAKSMLADYTVELFCDIDDVIDPIEVGGETTYQLKVMNQGSQPAVNIRLSVDFPAGLQPLGAAGDVQYQVQGQRVIFAPISRLDSQQEMALKLTARGVQEGDHRVIVSMSSDDRETPISKEETTRVYFDGR